MCYVIRGSVYWIRFHALDFLFWSTLLAEISGKTKLKSSSNMDLNFRTYSCCLFRTANARIEGDDESAITMFARRYPTTRTCTTSRQLIPRI